MFRSLRFRPFGLAASLPIPRQATALRRGEFVSWEEVLVEVGGLCDSCGRLGGAAPAEGFLLRRQVLGDEDEGAGRGHKAGEEVA